jgi:hypothetical protein
MPSPFKFIIAIVTYGGPLMPALLNLILKIKWKEKYNDRTEYFLVLIFLQGLAFLPFVIGLYRNWPDFVKALVLPIFSGIILFLISLVIVIFNLIDLIPEQKEYLD